MSFLVIVAALGLAGVLGAHLGDPFYRSDQDPGAWIITTCPANHLPCDMGADDNGKDPS
jgi:hypothetical protein